MRYNLGAIWLLLSWLLVSPTSTAQQDPFGNGPCSDARRAAAQDLQELFQSGRFNDSSFNMDSLINFHKDLVACDSTNPLGHGSVMLMLMKQGRYQEALDYQEAYSEHFDDPRYYLLLKIALIEELGDTARANVLVCREYEQCLKELFTGQMKKPLLKKKHYSLIAMKAEQRYYCNGESTPLYEQIVREELESNFRINKVYLSRLDEDTKKKLLERVSQQRAVDSVKYRRTTLKASDGFFLAKTRIR